DGLLVGFFARWTSQGAAILLVDDDVSRVGDGGFGDDAVFVDDRVLRWVDLRTEPARLIDLMRRGASGYPLNAFACTEGARPILDRPRVWLTSSEVAELSHAVTVIVNAVYDAESY